MQLKAKITNFMKELDLAEWYRGMSPFQDNAIVSLYSKLRDDYEQGTSFRVDLCLRNIGINPVVSKKKLSQIVQLSRGNDLAFLFFLLEAYYKVDCQPKKTYTINEQLLMTAICQLDIMMTIRELDRILPPGHPSMKIQMDRQRKEEHLRLQEEEQMRTKKPRKSKLPYFQKQPRPVEAAKTKKVGKPDVTVSFPFWKLGEKPVYFVRNEDRWFAEYKLNPVLRIVKECVDTAVGTYFEGLENQENKKKYALKKSKSSAKTASNFDFKAEDKEQNGMSETEPKLMCEYHKFMEEQIQLRKDTLLVAARDRCLEVINLALNERKIQRERITKQLNIDLDTYTKKYANLKYTAVKILHSQCSICQKIVSVGKSKSNKIRMISGKEDFSHPCTERRFKVQRLSGGGIGSCVKDGRGIVNNVKKCVTRRGGLRLLDEISASDSVDDECVMLYQKLQESMTQRRKYPKPGCPPRITVSPRLHFSLQPTKHAQQQLAITYPNKVKITKRRFFKAPTAHTPYSYNYKHIFNVDKPDDWKLTVEKSLLEALNEPESEPVPDEMFFECEDYDNFDLGDLLTFTSKPCKYTSSSESVSCQSSDLKTEKPDQRANIIDAVHKCIQTLIDHKRRLYEQKLSQDEQIDSETEFELIPKLKYDMDYFDPDDAELMNRMLKDGMSNLRKDPRFVLASLPDSHKLRLLREWIMRRYGKIYTEAACNQELSRSLKVLKAVTHFLSQEPPDIDKMGMPISNIAYSEHENVLDLARKIKDKYFNILNDKLMTQMNICWFAFSSYTAGYSRAKNTFFSYVPAHAGDVKREKLWQSNEYRDYRRMRSTRLLRELKQI